MSAPKEEEAVVRSATPAPAHDGNLEPAGELAAMKARLEALEATKEKQEEELKALRLDDERRRKEYEAWRSDKEKFKKWLASIEKRLPRSHSSRSSDPADAGGHLASHERRAKTKEDFWQSSENSGKKKGLFTRLRDR